MRKLSIQELADSGLYISERDESLETTPLENVATLAQIKATIIERMGAVCLAPWFDASIYAAYEVGQRDERRESCGIYETSTDIMESAIAEQRVVIERLEAWKASAMDVMAPLQDIAKEFSLPLGSSITEEVAKLVRTQAAEIARMRKFEDETDVHVNALQQEIIGQSEEISRLRNSAPEPVKHVASPSIGARWESGHGVLPAQMVKP